MRKTIREPKQTLEAVEKEMGVKFKRVWYFDVGKNHCYRLFVGKVFDKWCLNIGLGFCDFGYGFDKKD